MATLRIVIVGGGFAGVKCAKTLRKKLGSENGEIVLFNRENHMVFHPLLAEVAGASINPEAIAAPLRQILPFVLCRTEEVQRIDLEQGVVEYAGYDGQFHLMTYDHLVLACGSAVNLGTVPGMADHAFPLKTIGDAIALRLHIMQRLEAAEVCDDPARRDWLLSFIVVGGGFSGVEVAGEINDLLRGSHRFFYHIAQDDLKVTLVHSRDQLLPEITPSLREFARRKMEQAGIRMALNTRVAYVTPEGVGLADGRVLQGATVVCTVGNTIPVVIERLTVPKMQHRLLTQPDMRLSAYDNVWAVGDCAYILNAYDHTPCPTTGQFAERQGHQVAENIIRHLRGRATHPFAFKPLGQLCAIGSHNAVAEFWGLRLSGFLAWFLWRGVYLFKLPSWARRVKVGFDWAWDLVFSRDLAHPRTDPTERFSSAHYQPENYIFHQGDPGMDFYVITRGEVEVLRQTEADSSPTLLSVLGPGDFFGEMAIIDSRPRNASIRARTEVEVMVMGKNIFSSISSALTPFRDLMTKTIQNRSANLWQRMPIARAFLAQVPLSIFLEPITGHVLPRDSTLSDVIARFAEHMADFFCVVDHDNRLHGIVTRTDLFRAIDGGARTNTSICDFMTAQPVVVTQTDSAIMATETMRDHSFKWLPVVDNHERLILQGFVRAECMLSAIVPHLQVQPAP